MSPSIDPRLKELTRLKLALATFALQLDVFEVRARGALCSIGQSGEDARRHEPRKADNKGGKVVAP
jgi:hypothetical protein